MQPRLVLYSMYTDYAFMINEPRNPYTLHQEIMTKAWLNSLNRKGYTLSVDTTRYTIFYQYVKKLPYGNKTDQFMVFIIVAKNNSVDLYGEDIDRDIQAVYMLDKKYQNINKQVAMQFKSYEEYNETVDNEIEQAIVYRAGKQTIVHLTVGYVTSTKTIYTICPTKKFPNKFVYFTCKEIERITGIEE